MKKIVLIAAAILASGFSGIMAQDAAVKASEEQKAERMEWFDDAKLGIFIHWGIYAVDGVSESWSFHNERVPYDKYMAQKERFTASAYDPAAWVDLIKESGAKYTVLTSKHHDGVALWDTKANDLSVVRQTPAGRDLFTPFADEVRRQGLRLGIYFSLLDWSSDDYPVFTRNQNRYDIEKEPERWQRFVDFNFKQLRELASAYKPDLLWFDGDWEQTAEAWKAKEIIELLRSYSPSIVVNSRIQGHGDYGTPEIGVPVERPADRYWELCYTINDSWGFQHEDVNFKTPFMILRTFVDCISNGGNLLLDIGPREDGSIPEEEVEVLRELGRWNRKHAEAVYGTRAGIPSEHVLTYTSLNKDSDILYLYLPYKPNGPIEIKGLVNDVKKVRVVGNGAELTHTVYNKNDWNGIPGLLEIDVPDEVLDPMITVIAVELDGPVKLYR